MQRRLGELERKAGGNGEEAASKTSPTVPKIDVDLVTPLSRKALINANIDAGQ